MFLFCVRKLSVQQDQNRLELYREPSICMPPPFLAKLVQSWPWPLTFNLHIQWIRLCHLMHQNCKCGDIAPSGLWNFGALEDYELTRNRDQKVKVMTTANLVHKACICLSGSPLVFIIRWLFSVILVLKTSVANLKPAVQSPLLVPDPVDYYAHNVTYTVSQKTCGKLFLSELPQISTTFDNFWQNDGRGVKIMRGALIFHLT